MGEKKTPTHKRIGKVNIERIEKIGKFGESFNDVVTRVLDFWEEEHKEE